MTVRFNALVAVSLAVMTMRALIMICKFGMVLFIGRYLDLASLGLYGLITGAVAVGPVVMGLGAVHLLMRDAVTVSEVQLVTSLREYWSFVVSMYALAAIGAAAAVWLGASELWMIVVAIMLFEHLGNDVFQLFSNLQRPLAANVSAFLRGAAWVVAYVPIALWDPSLRSLSVLLSFWLVGSALAFMLFVAVTRSWPWATAFAGRYSPSHFVGTIRRSAIIYASDLSFVASQYLDRYLVSALLGLEAAGLYFLYWSAANAVNTFVSMVVLQRQRPLLIRAHHDGGTTAHRDLSRRLMRATVWATAAVSIAIGVTVQLLLPLIGKPSVTDHLTAFWLIMVGMICRTIADFGAMALFTSHRDRMMTITNVAAVVILAFAQLAMISIAGLPGAGAAIVVAFGGLAIWRYSLLFGIAQRPRGATADA
jgi:O-antigen/teichoic acid export membrane protein